jgi:small-conductance mechanosensitive channel
MIEWLHLHGIKLGITIVLGLAIYLLMLYLVPRIIFRTITTQMKDKLDVEIRKRSRTLSRVLQNTLGILIGLIVLFMILAEIRVNIGPALVSLGVVGLAVGFGAQSLIKDLINGLFILLENQYSIGDVVKIVGISGLVEEVNLRRTVLRDLDGTVHYIPNSEITTASNYTREFSRVNMNITVGYGEDLDHVIDVINTICAQCAQEPEWSGKFINTPQVLRVEKLADSGIEIKVFGDTLPAMQWEVMGELRKRLKKAFDKEGIEIPWPHLKVFFGKGPQDPAS